MYGGGRGGGGFEGTRAGRREIPVHPLPPPPPPPPFCTSPCPCLLYLEETSGKEQFAHFQLDIHTTSSPITYRFPSQLSSLNERRYSIFKLSSCHSEIGTLPEMVCKMLAFMEKKYSLFWIIQEFQWNINNKVEYSRCICEQIIFAN